MSINVSQIDVEQLKNYLKIVYGFRTLDDPSGDTDFVAGVDSKSIAVSSGIKDKEGNIVRNIIDNSLNLVKVNENGEIEDSIDFDAILTEKEAEELKSAALSASNNTSEDMRCLRNEMYHMKRDMIKAGTLNFDPVYDGFIDPFINDKILYNEESNRVLQYAGFQNKQVVHSPDIKTGVVFLDNVKKYSPDQYTVFVSSDNKALMADKINSVNTASNKLELEMSPITIMSALPDVVKKTYGLYYNGMFLFGRRIETRALEGENIVKAIFKDGVQRKVVAELNQTMDQYGFATTLTIPASLRYKYLRAIDLNLSVIGSPGALFLELYEWNEYGIYNNDNLIAVSNELTSGNVYHMGDTYTFTFTNRSTDEGSSKDIYLNDTKYVVVIKSRYSSTNNTWRIGGFEEECINEPHHDTYKVTNSGEFIPIYPASNGILSDAFIGITCVNAVEESVEYSRIGAYTGNFILEQNHAQRIRVSFNPRNIENKQYYTVTAKGRNSNIDNDEFVAAKLVNPINPFKELSHKVFANGKESANELICDLIFPKEVNEIEFQVIYNKPLQFVNNEIADITEAESEGLFCLVVSTDNGYTKEVNFNG